MKTRQIITMSALTLAACTPRRVDPDPVTIMRNGDRVAGPDVTAGDRTVSDQAWLRAQRDSIFAAAFNGCAADICAAVTRGEVALGMNETQLYAATRSTPQAWTSRRSGDVAVFTSARAEAAPKDIVAPIAMVQMQDNRIAMLAYAEPQGTRLVSRAADATAAAQSKVTADALVREGDALVATGQLDLALDRYDRASILLPNDGPLQYKIATVLDKQLRPIEALMRYQRFLHQMELERIGAYGDAYAKQAQAIAYARERIIVLEKR
jgi:tetratricopeptide (TPR) repeat protein